MTHRTNQSAPRGFTLLEIIVVVTIIALLATLIAPRLITNVDRAKVAVAKAEVNTIAREITIHCLDNHCLDNGSTAPDEDFELSRLTEGDRPPLSAGDLIDPWAHDYALLIPGVTDPDFNVVSYGSDGEAGGEGYAADIVNE